MKWRQIGKQTPRIQTHRRISASLDGVHSLHNKVQPLTLPLLSIVPRKIETPF